MQGGARRKILGQLPVEFPTTSSDKKFDVGDRIIDLYPSIIYKSPLFYITNV